VTTLTSPRAGHDVAYLLNGHGADGYAGAMSHYTGGNRVIGLAT